MFAFVCHFYGGMPADWLKVPVRTFFAMHRQGVVMEARQYSELADLHLISNNMKIDYYMAKKDQYRSIYDPRSKELPPRPGGPVFDSGSKDGMNVMRGVGRSMRRNMGYGR